MKLKIILLASTLYCGDLLAQTNERIKEKSRENQQQGSSSSSSSPSSSSSSSSSDNSDYNSDYTYSDYSAGADPCCSLIGSLFVGIARANNQLIRHKRDSLGIRRVKGGQLELNLGFLPNYYQVWIPRFSARAGVFSWDLRIYINNERLLNKVSSYSTFDAQLLQLNIITQRHVNFRVGAGAMLETYSGDWFPEYTLKLDVYPAQRYRTSAEMRIAPDYKTGQQVRYEWNGSVGYQVTPLNKPVALFVQGHVLWAKYYRTVEVLTGGLGLCMTF